MRDCKKWCNIIQDSSKPTIPPFFCKLTLANGEIVNLEEEGELTGIMLSSYESTLIGAEIGELCTSIGEQAFNSFRSLESISISSSVTNIKDYAFFNCYNLTSIIIPNTVTNIGGSSFAGCKGLTSINIPNSVITIGNSAFYTCSGLTSVVISNSVTSMGYDVFYNCPNLTSITINNNAPPLIGEYAFSATNNCPIYVPAESVNIYKSANGWNNYAHRIQAITN